MATPFPGDANPNSDGEAKDEKIEDLAPNGGGADDAAVDEEEEVDDEEDEDDVDEDEDDDDDDEGDEEPVAEPRRPDPVVAAIQRGKLNVLLRRLSDGPVGVHVHDVVIKGNSKTKDALIEAVVADAFREAGSVQDLLQAAAAANARLRHLEIFDSVSITLDAGPPELPGTANVVIEVVEAKSPLSGEFGLFSRPGARSGSFEATMKFKNWLGYGDIWDASGAYGWDQTSEMSAGVSLPRFKFIPTPLMARVSLLSQDWLKFSSYKERLLGLSFGLLSTINHDLTYNLTWRTLTDPSRMASKSIRSQLGHSLLSSVKYTYKIDERDSHLRPTRGYAFMSTTQVGGLGPDSRLLRFIRQEFDLRRAFPLGFYGTALNIGIAAGAVMPWGKGFLDMKSPLPERFHMGGQLSPICQLGGPTSLLGFKLRGLGPTDLRRVAPPTPGDDESNASPGRDATGGDLAVTAFADLSFDLPLKVFRDAGVHGHLFVNAGNLVKLTEREFKNLSVQRLKESFRSSAGLGIIFPTRFFRMEINYCYILKQLDHDHCKTGIQFSFSTP